jgi:hypothetical protein
LNLKTNQVFFGPQVGVGLHYTPKWAQWGKWYETKQFKRRKGR